MSRRVWPVTFWTLVAVMAVAAVVWLAMPVLGTLATPRVSP